MLVGPALFQGPMHHSTDAIALTDPHTVRHAVTGVIAIAIAISISPSQPSTRPRQFAPYYPEHRRRSIGRHCCAGIWVSRVVQEAATRATGELDCLTVLPSIAPKQLDPSLTISSRDCVICTFVHVTSNAFNRLLLHRVTCTIRADRSRATLSTRVSTSCTRIGRSGTYSRTTLALAE